MHYSNLKPQTKTLTFVIVGVFTSTLSTFGIVVQWFSINTPTLLEIAAQ
jgi:hypothetical protein